MTVAEREKIYAEAETERLQRARAEQKEKERKAAEDAERHETLDRVKKVVCWMLNNGRDIFSTDERREYGRVRNIRFSAQAQALLGEETSRPWQEKKAAKVESKILDTVLMRMAGGAKDAAQHLDTDDNAAGEYLAAAEWLLNCASNGLDEADAELILEAVGR